MTDNARELVSAAQALLRPPADTMGSLGSGVRARAAAMLLRLALEQSLGDFWHGVAPGMTRTEKHRILCLEAYTNRGTARRWYLTWSALSGACHHRTHELPPSPAEIQGRLLEVNTLLDALDMGAVATAAMVIAPPGTAADRTVAPPATSAAPWAQGRRATRPAPTPGPPPGLRAAPPVVGGP
ncbi:hypothetical protein OG909_13835 [Streptomyces sp. NBC_01754]|uniref:hypothetical protein n=1 Tax=Streptomyces sp. NBC_01754 TaxID=2975930 RepID=UPI002DD88086|nr:hypothetical protein [Streptomyces sp. NBC_01754]WSC93276.1 hypothetical protein OG909_13835 [Streptomyces sp. NBC_01754]